MSLSYTDEFTLSVKYKGINYYNLDIKVTFLVIKCYLSSYLQ